MFQFNFKNPYHNDFDYVKTVFVKLQKFGIEEVDITLLDYGMFELNTTEEVADLLCKNINELSSFRSVIDTNMLVNRKIIKIDDYV